MAAVVSKVDQVIFSSLGVHVYYMYGHVSEIVDRLKSMNASPDHKDKKYPLIALFQDFKVVRGEKLSMYGSASLNIIIATLTQPQYLAEQRYTLNFKPVLYPIYNELLNQLSLHAQFYFKHPIQHTEIDRLYWGKEGLYGNNGNIFNDYIDAIEIQNLQVEIKNKICSPHLK